MMHLYQNDLNKSQKQQQHYRKYKTGKVAIVNPGVLPKIGWGEVKKPSLRFKDSFIVDIDNTISDARWREHYVQGEKKQWDKFFSGSKEDQPIPKMVDLVKENSKNHNIIIITGRPIDLAHDTTEWLKVHNIPYDGLYMRANWDRRPDNTFKTWVYEKFLKGKTNISGIIDDQQRIRTAFKKIGISSVTPHYDIDEEQLPIQYNKQQMALFPHIDPKKLMENITAPNLPMSNPAAIKSDDTKRLYTQHFNNELKRYLQIHEKYIGKIMSNSRYRNYITQSFNRLFKTYQELNPNAYPMELRAVLRRHGLPLWYISGEDIMSAIL
jgi:hypothetical protein